VAKTAAVEEKRRRKRLFVERTVVAGEMKTLSEQKLAAVSQETFLPQARSIGPRTEAASPREQGTPAAGPASSPPSLLRIIEALLFVGGAPLTPAAAAEVIRGLSEEAFFQALDSLRQTYRRQGRPYTIQRRAAGYVLILRPAFHVIRERLSGSNREARLSPAAIEVLALVAYRQPVTRQEIDSLRGADSAAVLRQLIRHGLVTLLPRSSGAGKQAYYGTTARFLELFDLKSLEDLPRTQDLQQI
jgi:segregation and condensation protein B